MYLNLILAIMPLLFFVDHAHFYESVKLSTCPNSSSNLLFSLFLSLISLFYFFYFFSLERERESPTLQPGRPIWPRPSRPHLPNPRPRSPSPLDLLPRRQNPRTHL